MRARRLRAVAAALLLAAGPVGCGLHSGSVIADDVVPGSIGRGLPLKGAGLTIASKNFTENVILAEMIGLAFKAAGATVNDRTNISGSIGARQAVVSGTADAMYDYTGTAWITYLGHTRPITDPHQQWLAVRDADLKNGVTWLPAASLNNTYALAGNKANVGRYGLRTLSEVAALARRQPSAVTLCVDNEFAVRRDGLPGMLKAYGMDLPKANIRTMDAGIVYTTTAKGRACLLGEVYTTDGRITQLGLQVLEDDRHFFPNYNAAPMIHSSTLKAHPAIAGLLDPISARLSTATARQLNAQVDVAGRDARQVAKEWLVRQGFIKAR
ncbi:glycine betaine ABC transporter substrate-binding protein [Streptomyces sp. NPDC092296]|uniref:glycine betaine ABC transporter substrate-binding protein n=1 Tax=Streptomyces sp. NPDC092296 TaxID=3366012 RepID=UPI0038292145